MSGLRLDGPAAERLARDLLGWQQPRPEAPEGLATELRDQLEAGCAALGVGLDRAAAAGRGGMVWVTKTSLTRLACDGWQRDPRPYEHTRANVRGVLAHAAVERDWRQGRRTSASGVVEQVWVEEASRRPGDPSSLSRWLNERQEHDAEVLRGEVVDLLEAFREVWPELPSDRVVAHLERPVIVRLAGGRVVLRGVPDLVLDSPRRDDRARSLVVDLKTGLPRPEPDRAELRFYALLVTLRDGRPPFRWATFHVPEGRAEVEDLREVTLQRAVARVLDGVAQAVRLAGHPHDAGLLIRGGSWCRACRREPDCPEAATARARYEAGMADRGT